ncbi:uncharacterized protein LOC116253381 isoform X2 [Nymphaea colorata]|uniref:uncharacterized protein LOC116253381 isoform X2 n=1 Tax=Nymphaea colorata TaxID=210225 RepID=UPI00129DA878|nr:uncharacterized protein LOC116253381 isoform X2 [Nymphaea colorata]
MTLDSNFLLLKQMEAQGHWSWGLTEFGVNGGALAQAFEPKLNLLTSYFATSLGVVPEIQIKYLVAACIALKGVGGILFIFGSSFGAYLLLLYLIFSMPILHDFFNYDSSDPEFVPILMQFLQNLALFGALFFFLGMKSTHPKKQKQHHKKNASKAKTT